VQLSVRNMGRVGIGETMLLLEQRSANAASPSRLANAALTPRETEVLSWLAKGKTNRDIGDILGMSHRTVNKHLEHIFEKARRGDPGGRGGAGDGACVLSGPFPCEGRESRFQAFFGLLGCLRRILLVKSPVCPIRTWLYSSS
jgi:DNA-binding CsgD family transcriptional regulator